MTMTKDASVTVRLSGEAKDQLARHASAQGRSVSALLVAIVDGWLATMPNATPAVTIPQDPEFRSVLGRKRSEATREKSLKRAAHLLPWIRAAIAGRPQIVVADLLPDDHQPALPLAIGHALHGLGWTEIAAGVWKPR